MEEKKGPNVNMLLDELEKRIEETHRRFEMYFLGIERNEPSWFRDDCKRRIKELNRIYFVNTGQKFKFQNLKARFTLHETYWSRILKQIEEGTYKRHKIKADKLAQERQKEGQKEAQGKSGEAKAPATLKESPPTQSATSNVSDPLSRENVEKVYKDFVSTREKLGESTKGITPQALEDSMRKRMESLKEKYGDKRVEFRVVEKDGKAVLTAVIKK
ncbi:MAG: hypothetical protein Kow0090_23190 [Myxococcota bacterium]